MSWMEEDLVGVVKLLRREDLTLDVDPMVLWYPNGDMTLWYWGEGEATLLR